MKVAFITRSTLFKVPGGDTRQIIETAKNLNELGVEADVYLTDQLINYDNYDLLHFSNIIRPSDILYHAEKTNKPFVISPNLVDYSEYDKTQRKGVSGWIFRIFSADTNEYLKTIFRWLSGNDILKTKAYLAKGQKRSVQQILKKTAMVLANSRAEYLHLTNAYSVQRPVHIVPNGIDDRLFIPNGYRKNERLVACAARIEGVKNQLNLIRALNNSRFTLMILGDAAPNQRKYYEKCRKLAAANVIFTGRLSPQELVKIYGMAKVHVLPSWFETCGLSSLEAAAMGCNVVITDKGFTREYFGKDAYYCDPADPASILGAVEQAASNVSSRQLQERVVNQYTWRQAASLTLNAYKTIYPFEK